MNDDSTRELTEALRAAIHALNQQPRFNVPVLDTDSYAIASKCEAALRAAEESGKTSKIALLNDLCRKAMGVMGRVVQTSGINALPRNEQSVIREKVETFNAFTEDNDPHGEHDFGAFEHNGQRIFWKIDYYDTTLTMGSEDPTDPSQTVRVLTIMLASEY